MYIHVLIFTEINKTHTATIVENEEMKKRMYSCIVVVGGGLAFTGAQAWLQYLLWIQMSPQVRLSLETMDVYTRPKVRTEYLCEWHTHVMSTIMTHLVLN